MKLSSKESNLIVSLAIRWVVYLSLFWLSLLYRVLPEIWECTLQGYQWVLWLMQEALASRYLWEHWPWQWATTQSTSVCFLIFNFIPVDVSSASFSCRINLLILLRFDSVQNWPRLTGHAILTVILIPNWARKLCCIFCSYQGRYVCLLWPKTCMRAPANGNL